MNTYMTQEMHPSTKRTHAVDYLIIVKNEKKAKLKCERERMFSEKMNIFILCFTHNIPLYFFFFFAFSLSL